MRLRLLALLAAAALGLGAPAPALAQDNAAVAINTRDGSALFRFAFKIHRVAGEVVDSTNAAVAWSSCTRCETTAIAIQVVFAIGSPTTVAPTNVAVAVNEGCTLCETFASAYQLVVLTGGPVRFTPEGSRTIAEIKRAIRALKDPALTPAERQARLEALVSRLQEVLRTQLVPAGRPEEERGEESVETESEELPEEEQPARTATAETETTETTTLPATTAETATTPP